MNVYFKQNTSIHLYGDGAIINESMIISPRILKLIYKVRDHEDINDVELIDKMVTYGILTYDCTQSGDPFFSGVAGEKHLEVVVFELTNYCPLQCKFCYKSASPNKNTNLSLDFIIKITKRLPHAKKYQLTGGEPTCNPYFKEIVEHLNLLGAKIAVITNATNISEQLLPTFKKISTIQVSLYGTNKKTYKENTGVDKYDKFIKGISLLKENNIPYILSYSLLECNAEEIHSVFRFARKYGAHSVRIGLLFKAGRNKEERYINVDIESIFTKIRDISSYYSDITYIENKKETIMNIDLSKRTPFLNNIGLPSCGGFTTKITFNQNQKIKPCTNIPDCYGLPTEKIDQITKGQLPDYSFFNDMTMNNVCAIAKKIHDCNLNTSINSE